MRNFNLSVITTKLKPEELDGEIRRLLMYNPQVSIREAKLQLDLLKVRSDKEKREIIDLLTKSYKEAIKDARQKKHNFRQHILKWEEQFGPITLSDVAELLKDTHLSPMDVVPHKVKPKVYDEWLSQYLFGQTEYCQMLALAFYLHKCRMDNRDISLPRTNLLVYGTSGAGKTYGAQKMAELLNIPFMVVNCNSLVQEGIVGNSLGDFFTRLYMKVGIDIETSVVLLDEFDKLFENGSYNQRILNELLNIIDDKNSITFRKSDEKYDYEKITIKTNKMLFIFTGVFKGLEDIVRKRLGTKSMGFTPDCHSNLDGDFHQHANEDDFKNFFNRAELTGRIHQYAYVKELQACDMAELLLHSKESPVIEYENYFKLRGIKFTVTPDGAMAVAENACKQSLGVRGLKSLLFKIMKDELYSFDNMEIVVDEDYVRKKIC